MASGRLWTNYRSLGARLILCTAKPTPYAARILDHFGLDSSFRAAVRRRARRAPRRQGRPHRPYPRRARGLRPATAACSAIGSMTSSRPTGTEFRRSARCGATAARPSSARRARRFLCVRPSEVPAAFAALSPSRGAARPVHDRLAAPIAPARRPAPAAAPEERGAILAPPTGFPGPTTTPGCAPTTGARCCAIPPRLPADIRARLEAENAYADAMLAPTAGLQKAARARDAGAAEGGRQRAAAAPTVRGPITRASATAASIASIAAGRAAGGARRSLSTATRGPGQAASSSSAAPATRPTMPLRLERRRVRLGNVRRSACATSAPGADLADRIPNATGDFVWTRDSASLSLCAAGRASPPVPRHAASARNAAQGEDARDFRGAGPGLVPRACARRGSASARSSACTATTRGDRTSSISTRRQRPPRLIAPRRLDVATSVMDHGDVFFIRTQRAARAISRSSRRRRGAAGGKLARRSAHRDGRFIEDVIAFRDFLVVLARQDNRPRLSCATCERRGARNRLRGGDLRFSSSRRCSNSTRRSSVSAIRRWRARRRPTTTTWRERASALLVKKQAMPRRLRPSAYVTRLVFAPSRRTASACRCRSCAGATRARRLGAAAALRLRRLWLRDRRELLDQPAVARRSRLRLRHRPCARRHGQGLGLVRGRQARQEAQHVHRFHRRRPRILSPRATPSGGGSSRRAAARAAC